MKITWSPNPLRTIVELDPADLWALREAMELDHPEAKSEWLGAVFDNYVAALRDAHLGDCICVPFSCRKCQAEWGLEIDTVPSLGSHLAYKIAEAFGSENERSLDEAIDALAHYDPKPTSPMWDGKQELWDANLPRWKQEAKQAHAWLVAYRNEHFAPGST